MPSPRPHWSVVEVAGHPCEVHAPPDALPGRAIIYLHGLRERWLQEEPAMCGLVETHRLAVIAPRSGRSWWLDRIVPSFDPLITPERYVVDVIRSEMARRFGVEPPGIALLGMGMGGQGALRLAYRHPAVFPIAGAIAPAIDFHQAMREAGDRDDGECYDTLWQLFGDVERARQDTAILHVHPLNWPRHQCFASDPDEIHWHDGAARLHGKLGALGIPHLALLEPRGGGHGEAFEDRVAADVMAFVLDAFDKESRRVV